MPDPSAIRATVEAYAYRHTHGSIDELMELFASDAVVYDPVDRPPHVGREAIGAFFAANRELVDSLDIRITGPVVVAGNEAAFPLEARSAVGELRLAVDTIDLMTFDEEARITGLRAVWSMDDARPWE